MFSLFKSVPKIDPVLLFKKLESDDELILIDVRTPGEWQQTGVIPNSVLISSHEVQNHVDKGLNLDQGKPVIVVCRSGMRSRRVTMNLIKQGIDAYNLSGGIINWNKYRFPIEKL